VQTYHLQSDLFGEQERISVPAKHGSKSQRAEEGGSVQSNVERAGDSP
jgi:hypothetical protein